MSGLGSCVPHYRVRTRSPGTQVDPSTTGTGEDTNVFHNRNIGGKGNVEMSPRELPGVSPFLLGLVSTNSSQESQWVHCGPFPGKVLQWITRSFDPRVEMWTEDRYGKRGTTPEGLTGVSGVTLDRESCTPRCYASYLPDLSRRVEDPG